MTANGYESIEVEIGDDGIARLTLNRPEKLNALTPAMMAEIADALDRLGRDKAARCVLLKGAGKGFCAGGDTAFLEELLDYSPSEVRETVYTYFARGMRALKLFPKPTVAAVNGPAVGAGFDLALACDFRIASSKAIFQQSWINLGLITPLGGMYLLPRLVGMNAASEMLMLARRVSGDEGAELGLVSKSVPPEVLDDEAESWARRLASGPPLALQAMKEGLRRGQESPLEQEWEHNVYVQSLLIGSRDFAEGVRALTEKRPPQFSGN
jgi:enoyl-CoA hydratase/carnithine racemase